MSEVDLDFPRLWVEFPDPADPGQVFRCDLTWLTSRYSCIFGRGCPGVYTWAPDAGCCPHGAHFADRADERRVASAVARLDAETWQRRPVRRRLRRADWVETDDDGARKTRTVPDGDGSVCVFLNRPDFAGGGGCALHLLARNQGLHPLTTKPDVCWQLPIRRTFRTVERPDGSGYLEVTIGEYDRRGWGAGGLDFDWYCTGSPQAHGAAEPLFRSAAAELTELMGAAGYQALAEHCERMRRSGDPLRHPADGG